MSSLTDKDRKYWQPIESLIVWLSEQIPAGMKVLEVGPGFVPFPKATDFVDYRDLPNIPSTKQCKVDMNNTPLPYADKEFDFVYCRHVIEDMYNPFLLMSEMSRVAKAGYIETPSPMAELGRGVDGSSPPFRGYHHHRNIVWVYENKLRLIAKYPIIEYIRFSEDDIVNWLREGAKLWNTYFLWKDKIEYQHIQSGPDFVITRDYSTILKNAMDQADISVRSFWQQVPATQTIAQTPPAPPPQPTLHPTEAQKNVA